MEIKGIDVKEYDDYITLQIGGGETFDAVINFAVSHGWWGIENLSYIPGTAGASPVQNIGAYGAELKDTLTTVRAYDIHTRDCVTLSNEECKFGYRSSLFKEEKGRYCITAITLKLSKIPLPKLSYKPLDTLIGKESVSLEEIRDLVIKTRQEKLPDYHNYPNTGSFFKNPIITKEKGEELREKYVDIPLHESDGGYKISAAWLIEHIAEMKGVRVGDVGTWPKQPLVIVNYGKATYEDLMLFTGMITQKIQANAGIYLEREVNFVE
jgi:UDP-N-acetylmuramate dehydrogenase